MVKIKMHCQFSLYGVTYVIIHVIAGGVQYRTSLVRYVESRNNNNNNDINVQRVLFNAVEYIRAGIVSGRAAKWGDVGWHYIGCGEHMGIMRIGSRRC